MKQSLPPNSPVDARRLKKWLDTFGSYKGSIAKQEITGWLEQFSPADSDVAARLLDVVQFYGKPNIVAAARSILDSLPGWHPTKAKRTGKWRFCAMSGSAGESGDHILYLLRQGAKLDAKKYNELFITRRDLVSAELGADDTVVLVDDFSGTGDQICTAWTDREVSFGELLAGVGSVIIILIAATKDAKRRIISETGAKVWVGNDLDSRDNLFSDECLRFTAADKIKLQKYCKKASPANPNGYGNCGLVVVFEHRTPNNTVPILHMTHDNWYGLFPRHD